MMKHVLPNLITLLLLSVALNSSAQTLFLVQQPANLAGAYDFTDSYTADGWGADLDTTAVTALAAFAYDDGTYVVPGGGTTGDSAACGPIVNTADVAGKVAFIYRGGCNFSLKAYQAQAAGAVGCVIINNVAGNLINMLGGDSASAVTIPVIFVSDATGATLRDSILAGNVEVFIGNPNGVFANNVGAYRSHIGMAHSASIPAPFAQSNNDFYVPVGAWVFNYGSADANNTTLNVTIDRDGTEVYNQTSTGTTILPGDSLFIALDDFSESSYQPGFYTMTYSMMTDVTDELPVDNEVVVSFWINEEGIYSKSRVDPVSGPIGGSGLRPADGVEFEWCVFLRSDNAEAMHVTGMTFNTLTNDIPLTGEAVQLAIYEWNDPFDGTTTPTFDDLNELTDNEFYDYTDDLQGEFVTHTFAEPVELLNGQKYLACATIFTDNMFLGIDGGIDYNVTYNSYPDQIFFPLNDIDGGQWFSGGFGSESVPALIVNLAMANGIADQVEKMDITPYPNPSVEKVNIPLGAEIQGDLTVDIYNMGGQLVRSDNFCQKGNTLSMDVTGLGNGLHTFKLTFEDRSTTSFQVLISK